MTNDEERWMHHPSVPVTAYVPGHGVFTANLTTVLRTEQIVRGKLELVPHWLFRSVLNAWALHSGIGEPAYGGCYLHGDESEEQALVMLSSFHPANSPNEWDRKLDRVESWERYLDRFAADVFAEEERLIEQAGIGAPWVVAGESLRLEEEGSAVDCSPISDGDTRQ